MKNLSKSELESFLGPASIDGKKAIDIVNLPKNAHILDVGTGAGISAIFLASIGYKVTTGEPATDSSEYAKMDWRANAIQFGVEKYISFRAFEAQQMPFNDAFYDAVVFFGTLHHIDENARTESIAEAFRVCKPGGTVIFFEPTKETIKKVRERYPEHPVAANPLLYIPSFCKIHMQKIEGTMMDIYMLSA